MAPIQEFRKQVPKNYLEARFELQMLESDLVGRDPRQAQEPQKLLTDAKRAFDHEDYTECLRLSLRGRRLFSPTNMQSISISPGTSVEVPPDQPVPSAQRSSAPPPEPQARVEPATGEVKPTKVACKRCGKDNPSGNRFCRGCGSPLSEPKCPRCQRSVAPDDTFCGSCGAPLSATG